MSIIVNADRGHTMSGVSLTGAGWFDVTSNLETQLISKSMTGTGGSPTTFH